MSYWVKAILGLALFLAGLGAFLYGLYELMNIGTCASGGPYVSARPCPEGTAEKALLLPGGFIVGMIGIFVFALRGRRPGAPDDAWRASPWLIGWAPLFIGTGVVALVAGLGSEGSGAGTVKFTGIFLAVLFIPMGLVPVFGALAIGRAKRITLPPLNLPEAVTAPQPAAAPAPEGDPVERLRRLTELRDRGALSPAEFAAAKSKILAEL